MMMNRKDTEKNGWFDDIVYYMYIGKVDILMSIRVEIDSPYTSYVSYHGILWKVRSQLRVLKPLCNHSHLYNNTFRPMMMP